MVKGMLEEISYWLEVEVGGMPVLAVAREHVEVEITDETSALSLIVPDAEEFDVLVPRNVIALARLGQCVPRRTWSKFDKDQAEELLEDVQHALNRRLKREIFRDFLLVHRVLLLDHQAIVESMIPEVVATIILVLFASRFQVLLLKPLEFVEFGLSARRQSGA